MDFAVSTEVADYVARLEAFLDSHFPEIGGQPYGDGVPGHSPCGLYLEDSFHDWLETEHHYNRLMLEAGWRGADWPVEYGGQGKSFLEQWLLLEELSYRHLPNGDITIRSVARALMQYGTPEQKSTLLPEILEGRAIFSVGYTEPDVGSDLAALKTRAIRIGDEYEINGQKIYTTFAQRATHIYLAARTGDQASRHKGISILIVPTDTPGVTIRNLPVQGGERTNEVFFDSARVPVANLVGEENGGWKAIVTALAHERMQMHSDLTRQMESLARWLRRIADTISADRLTWAMRELASLTSDLEVGRLLALRAVASMDTGADAVTEAASAKIWISELRLRTASVALDLIGDLGTGKRLDMEELERFSDAYLSTPVRRFAGGTNEVLRTVVATQALGLPRSR